MKYSHFLNLSKGGAKPSRKVASFLATSLGVALAAWSVMTVITQGGSEGYYSKSELRFSEMSKEENVKGSVIPASCQSYPTFGVVHSSYDVGGHCANTCPAGTYATQLTMRMCVYVGGGGGEESAAYLYYSIAPSQSCPSTFPGQPNYYYSGVYNPYGTAYVCQKTCSDGSVITPHLGEVCPPRVNLFFN